MNTKWKVMRGPKSDPQSTKQIGEGELTLKQAMALRDSTTRTAAERVWVAIDRG